MNEYQIIKIDGVKFFQDASDISNVNVRHDINGTFKLEIRSKAGCLTIIEELSNAQVNGFIDDWHRSKGLSYFEYDNPEENE